MSASTDVAEIGRFFLFLILRFEANENRKSAAALTLVTLFAIVPLMTAGYSMLTIFPTFSVYLEQIHQFVFQHFFPLGSEQMEQVLTGFATQAKNLTFIGLILLLVSAISLMFTIENAFNQVWRIRSKRIGKRLVYYWLVILVGPLLLALGFLVSSYLLSSRLWLEHVESVYHVSDYLVRSLPFTLSVIAFTLMYHYLPSCKVKWVHGFCGGVIAAGLLEVCKIGFVYVLSYMPSYQIVYGAFAVVPLFLIWVFVAWCVVLLGAEVVRVIPFIQKKRVGKNASQLDWALMILSRFNQSHIKRVSMDKLSSTLSIVDVDEWECVLQVLVDHGWLEEALDEYEMQVDLNQVTIGELSEMLHGKRIAKIGVSYEQGTWFETLSPLLKELREHKKAALRLPIASVL